jgi:hypothetical protein
MNISMTLKPEGMPLTRSITKYAGMDEYPTKYEIINVINVPTNPNT